MAPWIPLESVISQRHQEASRPRLLREAETWLFSSPFTLVEWLAVAGGDPTYLFLAALMADEPSSLVAGGVHILMIGTVFSSTRPGRGCPVATGPIQDYLNALTKLEGAKREAQRQVESLRQAENLRGLADTLSDQWWMLSVGSTKLLVLKDEANDTWVSPFPWKDCPDAENLKKMVTSWRRAWLETQDAWGRVPEQDRRGVAAWGTSESFCSRSGGPDSVAMTSPEREGCSERGRCP